MQIDKKTLRNLFFLITGGIVFWWLMVDTARVIALLDGIWSLIAPFVAGSSIAFIFNVPMRAVERQLVRIRKPGLRRTLAILITLVILVLVIAFVVLLLIPQIELTIESLKATMPAFIEREAANVMEFLRDNPQIEEWILEHLDLKSLDMSAIIQQVISFAGTGLNAIVDGAFSAIGSVTTGIINGVVNTFLSVAFAFYALSRKEILARQGRRILYSILPERFSDEVIRVLRLTNATFSNFISGQCLEACILGCLFAVAMLILDMPYIPLVSVIIALTALVPIVGAFVGCFVGAFFILVESPVQAVTFVAMFLVLQQIEGNLIYPRVVGTSIGLPGMWVLAALTVGSELAGVIGMLVMIPLTSVVYALLREFTRKRVAHLKIPEEKLQDHPPELRLKNLEKKEKKAKVGIKARLKGFADRHIENLKHK